MRPRATEPLAGRDAGARPRSGGAAATVEQARNQLRDASRRGVSSIRKRCAQTITGRQRTWSRATIISDHRHDASDHRQRRCPARPRRSCRTRGPAGGSRDRRGRRLSLIIRKNQPPAMLIMLFQTSPVVPYGSSTQLKRSPPGETVDGGRLLMSLRHRLQRVIEAEGHVPRLAGEDHDHGRQLEADVGPRKERHQGEDESRHETEHRDALQDVEQRDQHRSRPDGRWRPIARRRA